MNERTLVTVADGTFEAYVARPAQGEPAGAMVVVQEIFGINADMRQTCDELASHGYMAVCPDLFWRLEPGVELSDGSEAAWKKGFGLYSAFDFDQGVADVAATMAHASRLAGDAARVGVMGFCLGGLMTFRTAARLGADAAVAFYGGGTERYLSEAAGLDSPLLMHLAGEDEYMPKDAQQAIREALRDKRDVEVHTYPGCSHAFARNGGMHFDAAAAALSWERTLRFLAAHLGKR